jgi:uncharacterized protein (DUF58 family)
MSIRPTLWGVLLGAALAVVRVLGPATADPTVTGFVWASFLVMVVLGAVWPVVALAALRVEIVQAPSDLVVDEDAAVSIRLSRGPIAVSLRQAFVRDAGPVTVGTPTQFELPILMHRRGVVRSLTIQAWTDAPFGIVRARRRVQLSLPAPLYVAPAPVMEVWDPTASPGPDGSTGTGALWAGDTVRSVRPYVHGDPSHLVHWRSTARTGRLVVRELEPPATPGLAAVLDLSGDPAAAEHAARRVAGLAAAVLGDHGVVVLCTAGADGPRAVQVDGIRAAGRVLAEAVPGPPGRPPTGWDVMWFGAGSGTP